MHLGEERGSHLGDGSGGGAQSPDRPELAAEDRHHGDRSEDRRREVGLGLAELGVGLVELGHRCLRGHRPGSQIGLDLFERRRDRSCRGGRPTWSARQGGGPSHHDHRHASHDQPPASPSDPRYRSRRLLATPGTGMWAPGWRGSAAQRTRAPMVPDASLETSSPGVVAERQCRCAASIPACHSPPSEWQWGGWYW